MVCPFYSSCLFYSSAKFTNNELPVNKRIHVFAKNTGTRSGMRGMFTRIPGNLLEYSGECSERYRGLFRKTPRNPFNFKLLKTTFYLKKANVKLFSETRPIFAISNETIERSNKIIRYFHFFWNSNWKEIATIMKERKKYKEKF